MKIKFTLTRLCMVSHRMLETKLEHSGLDKCMTKREKSFKMVVVASRVPQGSVLV